MDSPSRWAPDERAGMCAAETNTKNTKTKPPNQRQDDG